MGTTFNEFIGWLLGLERVRSVDQIEPSLAAQWAQAVPALVWVLCLAVAVLAVVFYLRLQRRGRLGPRVGLGIVRGIVLAVLILLLAEPVLTIKVTNSPRPLLWVLFDGSDSMNIRDELPAEEREQLSQAVQFSPKPNAATSSADPSSNPSTLPEQPSRLDYVRALVAKADENLFSKLSERFRIRAFSLDRRDGVRGLETGETERDDLDPQKLAAELSAECEVTALGAGFDDLARRYSSANLAGVVVLSDFDKNAGPPPLQSAGRLQVPFYCVGVGPERAVDLSVDLNAPLVLDKGERRDVTVTLEHTGLAGQPVRLLVRSRRLDLDARGSESGQVLFDQQVTLTQAQDLQAGDPNDQKSASANSSTLQQSIPVPFEPDESGRYLLTARIDPQEGEVIEQNNSGQQEVQVRDDFRRLMFVEYEPTWEWRFIKEVFYRDPLVGPEGFRTFLRSADPKVRYSQELFLPTLTPARKEFFANDVIFLGDMPGATLSNRFCELVKEFVTEFGGGLVIISGPRFGPGQLKDTPLESLLPVAVDPAGRIRDQTEFRLRLTENAYASNFDFMQLGGTREQTESLWRRLGRFPWYQPVASIRPGSVVLAEHPVDKCVDGKTPQPLIAHRQFPKGGQVIYLATNETWRLRRGYGERYYRKFWGQMIYKLAFSHALGTQKRFVVQTDLPQYRPDDTVTLTVKAYDANYEPLSAEDLPDRVLQAEIIPPNGRNGQNAGESLKLTIPMTKEGEFRTMLPASEAGEYIVLVTDPISKEKVDTEFQVASVSIERRSAVRNIGQQTQLAQQTGGKSYTLLTADQLPEEIQHTPRLETNINVKPLWNTPLAFGLVVLLLLAEWFFRKLNNLP